MSKLRPMMEQYQQIKAEHRDAILFFRLGDFYEMFGQDALEASKILDITLTARQKKDSPVPMCGIPHHAADGYIDKLTKAGKKIAICDQVSDPALPGIVKREVVRIITPGTTFSKNLLNQKANHFVMAIYPKNDYFGLAFADLTTGEFQAAELKNKQALQTEINRLQPAEIIVLREHYDDPEVRTLIIEISDAPLSAVDFYEEASTFLKETLQVSGLEGFGIGNWPFAIQASAFLLRYLMETQKQDLIHIDRITAYTPDNFMHLDESTIRNLELFSTLRDHEQQGTLLSILDQTETSMGGRLLRRWLVQPLLDRMQISARHASVEELTKNDTLRNDLHEKIKKIADLERLLARLSSNAGSPRDLIGLANSLQIVPEIKDILDGNKIQLLSELQRQMVVLSPLVDTISAAILEEPPTKITEGGIIKAGFNDELDELHKLMKDAVAVEKKAKELEYEIFLEIRAQALHHIRAIKQNAQTIAQLDVLLSFAITAIQKSYCKPEVTTDPHIKIHDGRHPVVEDMTFEKSFTPNDTELAEGKTEFMLITGPNMSGKSTYLRQVALIALMAQIGSFVPATACRLRTFDRIFTHVGASDNLVKGQSTFMVEMQETAYILNHATDRSLIILDEVGRGTGTYDGLSLTWSIMEFLSDQVRPFTLFATHYHELIELADKLERAANFSIDVHKIKEGGVDKSYGIEVARLAGMPTAVIDRAALILRELESEKDLTADKIPTNQMGLFARTYESSREPGKLTHPALEKLKELDINEMTPVEALKALDELKHLKTDQAQ